MLRKFLFVLLILSSCTAQQTLPVLKTNTDVLSIKDGDNLRVEYWNLAPEAKPDIYVADKTAKTKSVTFYSDIDSISFEIKPREKYDFVILLNDKDSCFTQVKSGLTYQEIQNKTPIQDTIPFTLSKYNNIIIEA